MTLSLPTIGSRLVRGPVLALLAVAALAGCQFGGEPPAPDRHAARADGWRVVERLGDIRYLAPDANSWAPAMSGTLLPAGSHVATGHGGRLILASQDVQVSAGTSSRFTLAEDGRQLTQDAGALRYRIGEADGKRLRIATPSLHLEADRAVFDVEVRVTTTEVQVTDGRIAIATPGGELRTVLASGHTALAGQAEDAALAVRTAQNRPFEPVVAEVLPAVAPKQTTAAVAADPDGEPTRAGPAVLRLPAPKPDHTAMATATRGLKGSAVRPAGYRDPQVPAPDHTEAAADRAPGSAEDDSSEFEHPVDERQRRFDRLTHRLLHGVRPARP